MGYDLNRLVEPVFMAVSAKPMLTEFGIDYRLESCDPKSPVSKKQKFRIFLVLIKSLPKIDLDHPGRFCRETAFGTASMPTLVYTLVELGLGSPDRAPTPLLPPSNRQSPPLCGSHPRRPQHA